MTLETIRTNLIKTIEGKQLYLDEVIKARQQANGTLDAVFFAQEEFLKINIAELNAILDDVEKLIQPVAPITGEIFHHSV